MKRDVIVGKLLKEGFSVNTLVKFNDKQLVELASRIISEGDVMISKKDPQYQQKIASAKKLNQSIETYEQELVDGQKKKDTKEQTAPLGSTPGLGDNPGSTELDDVTVTAKKTPTPQKSPKLSSNQINPKVNPNTSQPSDQKVGRLKTFANDMKSSLSGLPNSLKPLGAAPAAMVNAIGGQVGFKGRSEDQKRRGDLNRDSKSDDVNETNFGKKVTKGHNGIPEFMDSKKLKESEVKKWVKGLVENNKFHSFTSKNEIMELIKVKLTENKSEPSKPDTDTPVREKPTTKPGKPKRENPFEPKHTPKPKALGEDGGTKTAPTKPKVEPGTKPKKENPFEPKHTPKPKALGEQGEKKNKMPEFMKFKNLGFQFKDQN